MSQRTVGTVLRDRRMSAPIKASRRPASAGRPDWSPVLVDGRLVTGVGVAVGATVGAGVGVGAATTMDVIVAVHLVSAPPPLVEPLH